MELRYSIPAAGPAGKNMARFIAGLLDVREPTVKEGGRFKSFGRVLKEKHQEFSKIGLMNISPVPLQRTAYPQREQNKENGPFFSYLELLRNPSAKQGSSWTGDAVLRDFQERLKRVADEVPKQSCCLVPCGSFASHYLKSVDKAILNYFFTDCELPHPSFGWWNKKAIEVRKSLQETFLKCGILRS